MYRDCYEGKQKKGFGKEPHCVDYEWTCETKEDLEWELDRADSAGESIDPLRTTLEANHTKPTSRSDFHLKALAADFEKFAEI